jgi:hypothetical protein
MFRIFIICGKFFAENNFLFRILFFTLQRELINLLHITLRIPNTHHVSGSLLTEIHTASIDDRELEMAIVLCSGCYEALIVPW